MRAMVELLEAVYAIGFNRLELSILAQTRGYSWCRRRAMGGRSLG